jgi:hypothetical protein
MNFFGKKLLLSHEKGLKRLVKKVPGMMIFVGHFVIAPQYSMNFNAIFKRFINFDKLTIDHNTTS